MHSWKNLENLPNQFQEAELNLFKQVKKWANSQWWHKHHPMWQSHSCTCITLRQGHLHCTWSSQSSGKKKTTPSRETWFPGIDNTVKRMINRCIACPSKHPDPLKMSRLPPDPRHTMYMDFCVPFWQESIYFLSSMHSHNFQKLK